LSTWWTLCSLGDEILEGGVSQNKKTCPSDKKNDMSGRGKGGQGLGKGGAKRHRKVLRDNIQGITKPAIRRLARRGGIKRINSLIYEEIRGVIKVFLEHVIRDAVTYTEHAWRRTVNTMDCVYALKRQGRTMYGFDVAPRVTSLKQKVKIGKAVPVPASEPVAFLPILPSSSSHVASHPSSHQQKAPSPQRKAPSPQRKAPSPQASPEQKAPSPQRKAPSPQRKAPSPHPIHSDPPQPESEQQMRDRHQVLVAEQLAIQRKLNPHLFDSPKQTSPKQTSPKQTSVTNTDVVYASSSAAPSSSALSPWPGTPHVPSHREMVGFAHGDHRVPDRPRPQKKYVSDLLTPNTPAEQSQVNTLMAEDDPEKLLLTVVDTPIRVKDLRRLRIPPENPSTPEDYYLNDEIINAYSSHMNVDLMSLYRGKHFIFNTHMIKKLIGGANVDSWAKNLDICNMKQLFFPVEKDKHWFLVIANFVNKTIDVFDSMHNLHTEDVKLIQDFVNELRKTRKCADANDPFPIVHNRNCPKQNNTWDCGLFVVMYMDYLICDAHFKQLDAKLPWAWGQKNMNTIRSRLAYKLLFTKPLGRKKGTKK
jgi:histone H4